MLIRLKQQEQLWNCHEKRRIEAGESSSINNKSMYHKIIHEKSLVTMIEKYTAQAGSLFGSIPMYRKLRCVFVTLDTVAHSVFYVYFPFVVNAFTNSNSIIRFARNWYVRSKLIRVHSSQASAIHHWMVCSSLIHTISANRRINISSQEYFHAKWEIEMASFPFECVHLTGNGFSSSFWNHFKLGKWMARRKEEEINKTMYKYWCKNCVVEIFGNFVKLPRDVFNKKGIHMTFGKTWKKSRFIETHSMSSTTSLPLKKRKYNGIRDGKTIFLL